MHNSEELSPHAGLKVAMTPGPDPSFLLTELLARPSEESSL